MIKFNQFSLSNGLKVLVHEDHSTPMAVVNVLYDVGARDEHPDKTGFAHLFEHLMFGGSRNIPSYDEPLQLAGGENNAYTTNDFTDYYCQIPADNIETAFWLESDRMLSLAFGKKSLEVQRKVVSEEFKEHYINKPYGDAWHKMRTLAFKEHPYRWMTIGASLSHIEEATLEDVEAFFKKHYSPANAILTVAGNVTLAQVEQLAEKWFGDIPSGKKYIRNLPQEPEQNEHRHLDVHAKVPLNAFYKSWHMASRLSHEYYVADLISEILSGGGASRLHQTLVKEQQLFTSIDCYHFGTIDAGLMTIEGKLVQGVDFERAEKAVDSLLVQLKTTLIAEKELQKVINRTESIIAFEDMSLMNRANSLAFYTLLGDTNMINNELERYQAVTASDIQQQATIIFDEKNSSTMYYYAQN